MEKDLAIPSDTEQIPTITTIGLPDRMEEIHCAHIGLKEIYAKWGSKEDTLPGTDSPVAPIYL